MARTLARPALAVAVTVFAGSAAAVGQCANWSRSYVPDFDQKRSAGSGIPALPGNGGMYCVPTSITNWFAYFANRGISQPQTLAGPRSWQSNTNYNRVTSTLATMGSLMATSTSSGTTGSNGLSGAYIYSLAYAQGKVVVNHYWCGGGYCPTPARFTNKHIMGGFIAACYGYYDTDSQGRYTRDGGHCITINGADTCSSTQRIRFRDPASDSANTTQSTFTTHTVNVVATPGLFRGKAGQSFVVDVRYKVNYGSSLKFLDGWYVLDPIVALTSSSTDLGGIQLMRPFRFEDSGLPAVQNFATPAGTGPVGDMVLHPQLLDYYYITRPLLTGASYRIYHLDPVTGVSTMILSSADEIRHLVFSRHGELFACDGSVLKAFVVDGPTATLSHSLLLPAAPDAMAYDDQTDALALLMPTTVASRKSLVRYPRTLGTALSSNFLPGIPALNGVIDIEYNPEDGTLGLCDSGIPTIFRFNNIGDTSLGTIPLPQGTQPRGLSFADSGNVLYIGDGSVRELMRSPTGGWVPAPDSVFAGLPARNFFSLARSRTNHLPALHEGPEWANLENPEIAPGVPDCYANCDGSETPPVLNVNDFQCFLNLYASGRFEANCDDSTIVPVLNVNDFICFQQKYAAGCP